MKLMPNAKDFLNFDKLLEKDIYQLIEENKKLEEMLENANSDLEKNQIKKMIKENNKKIRKADLRNF